MLDHTMDSACSHRGELLGYVIVCLVSVRDLQNDVPCAAVREKKSKTAARFASVILMNAARDFTACSPRGVKLEA